MKVSCYPSKLKAQAVLDFRKLGACIPPYSNPGLHMLAEQRRHQIMLELQRSGQARTRQMADDFGVSEVTIRSDLGILNAKKQLIKTHGGAVALPVDSPAAAFEERMHRNFNAKRRIAQMAARLIIDNQSLVFDSGSTLLLLAMQMPPVKNVVVATNAMNIAQHLMYRPGLDVHMIGGRGLSQDGQHDRVGFRQGRWRPRGAPSVRQRVCDRSGIRRCRCVRRHCAHKA